MRVYFSGTGGMAIGPLAEIAYQAGYDVVGSDITPNLMTRHLEKQGIPVLLGQDGSQIKIEHSKQPIDWLVYSSALPDNHPELMFARNHGIRISKRDEFLLKLLKDQNLKLIAVAGTHGKTTTTGMMVWTLRQLGVPVSYSLGTTVNFAPSGHYDPTSEYFIYECDEFDRNFLHFQPYLSLITSVDYDHHDTYPTQKDYISAFNQFLTQSERVILWQKDIKDGLLPPNNAKILPDEAIRGLKLAGQHNRANATLVVEACKLLNIATEDQVCSAINDFPGTDRRFEKLADNLYSDYGHHPTEIKATLQMASELSNQVVLVYQPHQNVRQHEIRSQYTDDIFTHASKIYWLPTYLTREDPSLPVLKPQELTSQLSYPEKIHYAELDDNLWQNIRSELQNGKLVLCMGAGTIDGWLRNQLESNS